MPAKVMFSLILIAIAAGGLTVLAALYLGWPLALVGLAAACASLALRLRGLRK